MQMTQTALRRWGVAAVSMTLALRLHTAQISSCKTNLDSNFGGGTGSGRSVPEMVGADNSKWAVFNTGLTVAAFYAQVASSSIVSIAAANLFKLNPFKSDVTDLTRFCWNIAAIDNRVSDLSGESGGPFWNSYGFQSTAMVGTAITSGNAPDSADPGIANTLVKANVFFNAQNTATGNPLATGNVVITDSASSLSSFGGN